MWLSQCACRYGWFYKVQTWQFVRAWVSQRMLWVFRCDSFFRLLCMNQKKILHRRPLHSSVFPPQCLVKACVVLAEVVRKMEVLFRVWIIMEKITGENKEKGKKRGNLALVPFIWFTLCLVITETCRYFLHTDWDQGQSEYVSVISWRTGPFWQKNGDAHKRRSRL